MSTLGLEAQARSHRQGPSGTSGAVRRRPHVAVGRTHRHPEGMSNRLGAEQLVVARKPGQDGQPGRVGTGPAVGPAVVARHVEHGARLGFPPVLAAVPMSAVQLVEKPVVAVDEDQVPVAPGVDIARLAALDVARRGPGRGRNRVAGRASRRAIVALVTVRHPGDRDEGLGARHADVWHPVGRRGIGRVVGRRPPVRVDALVADPGDVGRAVGIEGCLADVDVPPVVGREQRWRLGQGACRLSKSLGRQECQKDQDGRPRDLHDREARREHGNRPGEQIRGIGNESPAMKSLSGSPRLTGMP